MADYTWTGGAGDGNWNTAGNWAGGAAPSSSASNHVYINAANATTPSITVGPSSAIDLGSLNILNGFGGTAQNVTFGAGTVPVFGTITTFNVINTRCSVIKISCTAITTANIRALGGATLYFVVGACTTLNAGPDGRIEVEHDFALTTVRRAGGSMLIKGKTTPADMNLRLCRSAVCDCWRRISSGIIDGKLTVEYSADGDISAGTSQIFVNATGKMLHKATGDYDHIEVAEGGTLDGTKNPGKATNPTITTLIRNSGSKISIPTSMFTVSYDTMIGFEDAPPV